MFPIDDVIMIIGLARYIMEYPHVNGLPTILYDKGLPSERVAKYPMIWTGLLTCSTDSYKNKRDQHKSVAELWMVINNTDIYNIWLFLYMKIICIVLNVFMHLCDL